MTTNNFHPEDFFDEALYDFLFAKSDLPSLDRSKNWHHASSGENFYSTPTTGKWCLFHSSEEIDAAWKIIKVLVEKDHEFIHAKVSTRLSGRYQKNGSMSHVICVYTKDYTDISDINRTRNVLVKAGWTQPIQYKRDEDTRLGIETFIYTI